MTSEFNYTISDSDLTITPEAREQLTQLWKQIDDDTIEAIRIFVSGGGCSGINYSLKFTDREPNDRDQVIHFANGTMKLIVPFASYVYLTDTEIDFSDDLLNGGFKFGNPQANRTCGCGTSFSV